MLNPRAEIPVRLGFEHVVVTQPGRDLFLGTARCETDNPRESRGACGLRRSEDFSGETPIDLDGEIIANLRGQAGFDLA